VSFRLGKTFLRAAREHQNEGAILNIRHVLHLHGTASTPVILLIMATCCLMPVGGIGTVLSFAMVAMAWKWSRMHETTFLPERIANVELSHTWARRVLKWFALMYVASASWLKPRLTWLSHDTLRAWWAVWIAMMAFLIFLPIPFGNVLPGLSLILFSLAWMFRDGLFLLAAMAVGVAAMSFAVVFGHVAWAVLHSAVIAVLP